MITLMNLSCGHRDNSEPPIKIMALSPLQAKIGETIRWEFKATRGNRSLKHIQVTGYPLPFGVKPDFEQSSRSLSGKVLGAAFRNGTIIVTAFDQESCIATYRNMARMTIKNSLATGLRDLTLPVTSCDVIPTTTGNSINSHTSVATFDWRLDDGPDDLSQIHVREFLTKIASQNNRDDTLTPLKTTPTKTNKQTPKTMGVLNTPNAQIPSKIAPGSFDLNLGACASRSRPRCGDAPLACLWALNTCMSPDITGRKPEEVAQK
jgi:hypothetical protein